LKPPPSGEVRLHERIRVHVHEDADDRAFGLVALREPEVDEIAAGGQLLIVAEGVTTIIGDLQRVGACDVAELPHLAEIVVEAAAAGRVASKNGRA